MTCPVSRKTATSLPDDEKQALVILYKPAAESIELWKVVKDGTYALGGQHAILIRWLHPGLLGVQSSTVISQPAFFIV
jgi:hypothetical protein